MASVAHLGATGSTSNASSYVSGSFSPTQDDLLVVCVVATGTLDDTATLVESAGGGTYSLIDALAWNGTSSRLYLFVADQLVGASPPSRTFTLTLPTDAATGCSISVERVVGVTEVGAAAVVQAKSLKGSTGTTPELTLDAAIDTGNPVLLACAVNVVPSGLTEPSGFTEIADPTFSNPTTSLEISKADSGVTASTITWGTSSPGSWGAMCVEFSVSGGGLTLDLGDIAASSAAHGIDLSQSGPVALSLGDIPAASAAHGINLAVAGPLALELGDIPSTDSVFGIDLSLSAVALDLLLGAIPSTEAVQGIDLSVSGPVALSLGAVPSSDVVRGIDLAGSVLPLLLGNIPGADAAHGINLAQSGPISLPLGDVPSALVVQGLDLSQSGSVALALGRVVSAAAAHGVDLSLFEAAALVLYITAEFESGVATVEYESGRRRAEFEAGVGQGEYEGGVRVSEYSDGMRSVEF